MSGPAKPTLPGRDAFHRVPNQTSPVGANAPSILLPLRFILAGVASLVLGVAWVILRPEVLAAYHYNQYVVAITHLFVLGWICLIVMGAMYQLVPVALETRLYSEALARWQFLCHLVGCAGMVWMFWRWDLKQVGHFGSLLGLGVLLFVYNIGRTLCRVPRWNVVASGVTATLGWLTLTVLAGLTIAAGKCSYEASPTTAAGTFGGLVHFVQSLGSLTGRFDAIGAMHAHAHLGVAGVFLMLIVGISFKLVPMFTLSEVQNRRRAGAALLLLNAGLVALFFAILTRSSLKPWCAALFASGLALYALELRAILRARKRRALDWGLKYFLTALTLLLPVTLLGLVLSWPALPLNVFTGQLENLYGFLALLGVVSLAILGMLYKIVPFLVWYRSYSSRIGLAKVPALADLYSARLQGLGYWTYLAGLAAASAGILAGSPLGVRCGFALLLLSLASLGANLWNMLRHLSRPQTAPLAAAPAVAPALPSLKSPVPAK